MGVCDVVEKLLCVQRATEKQSQITIWCFNDIGDNCDCCSAVKRVLVGYALLVQLCGLDQLAESLGNSGQECWNHGHCEKRNLSRRLRLVPS